MRRVLTYRADSGNGLTLSELLTVLDDAKALDVRLWSVTPSVRFAPSRKGATSAPIHEIRWEGSR